MKAHRFLLAIAAFALVVELLAGRDAPPPVREDRASALDPAIQRAADAALDRARAVRGAIAVVTLDGRVLALAGRDGDRRAPDLATETWAPAASIFKLVTAAALLDAGVRPDALVCYHGGERAIEAHHLRDDPRVDQRCGDLGDAIAFSNNAIIAKLAVRHLTPDAVREMADALGFGPPVPSSVDMAAGRADIPDSELAFARVSAGFWHTEISPLGGALLAATVASGGLAPAPHTENPLPPRRVLSSVTARALAAMMVDTTRHGTAQDGFVDRRDRPFFGHSVAGKTGTLTRRSPRHVQYSWFVGFAPVDRPRVAIAVLLANPQRWRVKAHTVARMVLAAAL